MIKYLSIVITALLLFSCSSEKPGVSGVSEKGKEDPELVQQARSAAGGVYALELAPEEATRNSKIQLVARGVDLSSAKIEWSVNGIPFTPVERTQFDGADATKGDTIQAKAFTKDRVAVSNIVMIMNAAPKIVRINYLPEVFKSGDSLGIEAIGSDVDGDEVTFLYEWTKNGEPAGTGKSIEGSVKRGDKFSVTVTPFDGEASGGGVVLDREIGNMPPMIVDHKNFTFDGKVYSYQVKAADPDGDALTYSLEPSSDGIAIDPASGLLQWEVPLAFTGEKNVTVIVADGHGGTAKYPLKITIQQQPPPKVPAPG